jgi:HEAT repeat protein
MQTIPKGETMFSRTLVLVLMLLIGPSVSAKTPSMGTLKTLVGKAAECPVVQAGRCEATKAIVSLGKGAIVGLGKLLKTTKKKKKAVVLAALGDLRAVELGAAILQQVNSKDPLVKHAAVIATTRIKPKGAVKVLAKAIGVTDPVQKAMVAAALGQTRSPAAFKPLTMALKHPHPRVQITVVQALAQLGLDGVFEEIKAFHENASHKPPVQIANLRAFAILKDKRATPLVTAALNKGSVPIRKAALKALKALRDPACAAAVIPLLKDRVWVLEAVHVLALSAAKDALPALIRIIRDRNHPANVIEKVFWAIGETKETSAIPTLLPYLKDPQADTVVWAAAALGRIGGKEAAFGLFDALKRDEKEVKNMAIWALEKISGKRLGKTAERWETWVFDKTRKQ